MVGGRWWAVQDQPLSALKMEHFHASVVKPKLVGKVPWMVNMTMRVRATSTLPKAEKGEKGRGGNSSPVSIFDLKRFLQCGC